MEVSLAHHAGRPGAELSAVAGGQDVQVLALVLLLLAHLGIRGGEITHLEYFNMVAFLEQHHHKL